MKLKMKLMAAAVALAAASGAHAGIAGGSNVASGDLFLTVYDVGADLDAKTDDRAYVLDLGALANGTNLGGQIAKWGTSTALQANKQALGTIFTVAPDANLTSFLNASAVTSRLKWNIAAVDSSGNRKLLTTASAITTTPILATFRNMIDTGVAGYVGYPNNNGITENGSIILNGATAGIAAWNNSFGGTNGGYFTNAAGLGNSLNLFMLSESVSTGEATSLAKVDQFMANSTTAMQWTLAANGELTYGAQAVAAIPEPSEYALMLAGLGMLGFMARRRLNNRA